MTLVSTRLGPYDIVEQIGAGGMGVVYGARDSRLHRDVAIKVLPPGVINDEDSRGRFRRESLALAKLSHPFIATLFDVGEENGISYLVMERVSGESLAARIAAGPLSVRDVVAFGAEIAAALDEAHEHGVVHRDLKPANVMVTAKRHVKVLDFGLVKLLRPDDDASAIRSMTETQGVVGTLLYMSPEQATGEPVDGRSDLWSLGVLLYEALTGMAPFEGAGTFGVLRAITQGKPASLRAQRPDVPPELEQIIARALAKNPAERYQSAREMEDALTQLLVRLSQPAGMSGDGPRRGRSSFTAAVAVGVLVVGAVVAFAYERMQHRAWAVEQAPQLFAQLQAADRPLAAFELLDKARSYAPADTFLYKLDAQSSQTIAVTSSPSGAQVEIQDYVTPDTTVWHVLGTTPITRSVVPRGWFRWRVGGPKLGIMMAGRETSPQMHFALDSTTTAPAGMVYVPGQRWGGFISFVGWVGPYKLPSFYMDRLEVTNLEYQRFVDAGGYSKRELWPAEITDGTQKLTWSEAMERMRDSTGRPGPATWKGGHFPDGRGGYPVNGVSWYEASAYAAWAGKALPSMAQWYYAAPPDIEASMVKVSNISRDRLEPAGLFRGVGPFGTYDMAGNVREWVSNPASANRYLILGGAWSSPTYMSSAPEALGPFDRSPQNGLRCVRNLAAPPPASLAMITTLERDFTRVTPVSDEVFRSYGLLYAYDRRPLNARAPTVVHDGNDWREERVQFSTAYDDRMMTAYVFLPKHVKPPYQTLVFFPSARILDLTDSKALGDISFFDYVVESGRAVVYPIYQGTYERRSQMELPGVARMITTTVQRYQDLARTLDYLATRPDMDTTRFGYLGVSWGAADGVIYSTLLQNRLKTAVLLDGGYFLNPAPAGRDQADFAPRLRIPVLMVNGRYDYSFSLDRSQDPLFRMLGTPDADKRHVVLDTPHDVRAKRPELIGAVLPWLDKYLGTVH